MVLTLEINRLETITQVKQELNLLSKLMDPQKLAIEAIKIQVSIGALRNNEFLEPAYELTPETNLEFYLLPSEEKISLTEKELESSEDLMTILDDLIFDELTRQAEHSRGFTKRKSDVDWGQFEETIQTAPSLDSLYHKIKHDEEWAGNKKVALYKILLHSDRILDIENVNDFIENFFEIRFADLILKYPLKKSIVENILRDPNLNPVVLAEYQERHEVLESVESILKTKDTDLITSYFFKMVKRKSHQNISHELLSLLKDPVTPKAVIEGVVFNFDITFLYDKVLSHPNCPEKVLEKYAIIPAYGISIIKNPNVPGFLIDRMVDHFLEYDNKDAFIKSVFEHANTLNSTKQRIEEKAELMKDYLANPSAENLNLMINNKIIRFTLEEIFAYARSLKRSGKISDETISIIEESFADAWSKINKSLNINTLLREYPAWDPERTQVFIHSSLATAEACEAIYQQEIKNQENLEVESPIMQEISKKFDNVLPFTVRENVFNRLKEKARSETEAQELADQIINNVVFLDNKFTLSAKEKQELISSLIENQALNPHIKDKLNSAS